MHPSFWLHVMYHFTVERIHSLDLRNCYDYFIEPIQSVILGFLIAKPNFV